MKKFLRKHWPLLVISVFLAAATAYIFQGQKDRMAKATIQERESEEGIRLKDIHYVQDDPGQKAKWMLDASEAKLSKDQQFVTFVNFHVTLEPENRPRVTMEGKQGEFDKRTGQLLLQGDLVGHTEDGYRFTTEQAVYYHKEGYLKTDKVVKISGSFFSIEGTGLFLDLGKETMLVLSNVTTLIHGEPPVL